MEMNKCNSIPETFYGVLQQDQFESDLDEIAEQVRRVGYAILDSGYSNEMLKEISKEFNSTRGRYVESHGEEKLKSLNEFNTIRSPLTHGGPVFLRLVFNANLMAILRKLIAGKFILNQQNGVINPPGVTYNQGAWHRDLPYQHFVSTSPLAVNALFCVDDFTLENGSTFVLPASHKTEAFPSWDYVRKNAVQVDARAGQFILLDCMVFHSGGFNRTDKERRAVNHVFNIPYFKQQINIPINMQGVDLSAEEKEILGFTFREPGSVKEYLTSRAGKKY
jgi:ectoine hydroxylase-related dioxygenase (phytanoyl-CoA dioxygenase family)